MTGNGFIYFVEHQAPQVKLDDIDKFGLSYAFDEMPNARECMRGPSGSSGHCLARQDVEPCGYYPDRQTWQQSEVGRFWVGYDPKHFPGPADLQRDPMIAGRDVRLQDGNNWHVPVARSVSADTSLAGMLVLDRLPHTMRYKNGRWEEGDVLRKYRSLWETASRTFDEYLAVVNDNSYQPNLTFDDAIEALSANYAISFDEASILGLFTSTGPEQMAVLRTLFDADSFIEWGKKKLAQIEANENSNSGNEG